MTLLGLNEEKSPLDLKDVSTEQYDSIPALNSKGGLFLFTSEGWIGEGRITRSEYWTRMIIIHFGIGIFTGLVIGLILFVIEILSGSHNENLAPVLTILLLPILFWLETVQIAKRFHDLNHSGWWALLAFTVVAVPFLFIYLGFSKEQKVSIASARIRLKLDFK
jgi:uncharacterized membrane protein YhaH (DUF805 family)